MILNIYRNSDFVFNNPYVFNDRYALEDDYFSDPGRPVDRNVWKTNFVPDVRTFSLQPSQRGMSANGMQFVLSNNQAMAHITAFPPGVYKLGHRHGVGAHVLILDGEGYSLLWFEGQERERVNWQDGTVLSPKEGQYHQHFNAAPKPARYVAFRLGDLDNHRPPAGQGWNTHAEIMGIQYDDEDPAIYNLYVEECARRGTTVILPRPSYAKA
ncbi:MAG: Gentisate 1,2-dioxygenase [Chloroflexi bacterium]|nr:Gentisate 1,2-dioxygenase [Chloroflexota bacterium]